MTTTPRRPLPATGLRRLGVLLVLAGVLAMHTLGGGSHMAMSGADGVGGQPATSATAGGPDVAHVDMRQGMVPAGGGGVPAAGTAPRTGTAPVPLASSAMSAAPAAAPGSGVAMACLAVLLGLVLLVARAAFGVPWPGRAPAANSTGHGSAPLGRGPPRGLLAQLCVLRT